MKEKTAYAYDEKYIFSGEVNLDDTDKSPSGSWNIPAWCTDVEPPIEKEGFVRIWNGKNWEYIEDHRGKKYWMPDEDYKSPGHEVTVIGPLPEGASTIAPQPTPEEIADQEASQQAAQAMSTLNSITTRTTRSLLAGGSITAMQAEYQTALAAVPDAVALKMPDYFPTWDGDGHTYKVGDRVTYNDTLYKVLQAHTSQNDWTPDAAPSLFAKVLTSTTGEPLPWEQPDSTNPYMIGDRVTYNGKVYESTVDNNVWAPDAYPQGWKEVTE